MMQDQIIPVNNEAMQRALTAVVGPDASRLVGEAYKAIDAAMAFGYTKGNEEGFKAGYQRAEMDGKAQATEVAKRVSDDAYDDGYVDGVADARAHPEYADAEVAKLTAEDEYDEANVSDSGDENPAEVFDTIVARGEQPEYSREGERLY